MKRSIRLLIAGAAVLLLLPAAGSASPVDARGTAVLGAQRLLALQNPDGSMPWQVGSPGVYQNVQGISAYGMLEAFKLSGDTRFLDSAPGKGARAVRNWLVAYRSGGANPPSSWSASNIFFLADYAVLTGNTADLALARRALSERVAALGGSLGLADTIISARKSQGHGNLGLWDAMLYVKAAQAVGDWNTADIIADRLIQQTIVDPLDPSANWFELGLSGTVMALAETDPVRHRTVIEQLVTALKFSQESDGSFPSTFGGTIYPQDTQSTAYAVLALAAAGDAQAAEKGSQFLMLAQKGTGGFVPYYPDDQSEYAEIDSEVVWALAAVAVPAPRTLLAPLDDQRSRL